MKKTLIALAVAALAAGCTVVPAGTAHSACELLQIASAEADMAPAWYVEVGDLLESCGRKGAKSEAATRACFAEARNGYRDSKECEAAP